MKQISKISSVILLIFAVTHLSALPPATGVRHDVSEVEIIEEEILSVLEALDLETCPATLVYNVPGGQILTESGRYCLAEDITVTGTGIIIEGNGITLDLNGHSIILTGSSGEIGIAIATDPMITTTYSDIRIKNGMIINIDPPVYVAPLPMDSSPTFTNNVGISVGSGTNIVHDLRLEDITCVALDAGILLNHAINTEIDRVTCESCNVGLFGTNQVSLFARDSIFNNNVSAGFAVVDFVPPVLSSGYSSKVINCGASNNGLVGFVLVLASDFLFQDCFAAENQENGFIIVASRAISLVNCLAQSQYNNITDPYTFQANGFSVTGGSIDVIVRECSAINNKDFGFNEDGPANQNQYYSNYACNNGTNFAGIFSAPVTSPANARGVHNVDCSNSALDEVDSILSIVENIDFVVDALATCPVTLVYNSTPQPLIAPGRYCLAEDLVSTVTIAGNNITLDLNGYIISTSSGDGIDVLANDVLANFVTIKNGTITASGGNGITVSGGVTDLCIEGITCYNCFNNGIELDGCNEAIIQNVICDFCMTNTHLTNGGGIYLNGSENVLVSDSLLINGQGAFNAGLYSTCSSYITVQRCSMNNNAGAGISLNNDTDCIISDCSALKNDGGGMGSFALAGVKTAVVSNCIAESTGIDNGFSVDAASSNIVVKECSAIKNQLAGFSNGSDSAQFYGNSAIGNNGYGGGYGFYNSASALDAPQFYSNYACNNGTNYSGVVVASVTSPANARGVANVDCSNSALDEIVVANSKLDILLAP